jgi:hypothetical protein
MGTSFVPHIVAILRLWIRAAQGVNRLDPPVQEEIWDIGGKLLEKGVQRGLIPEYSGFSWRYRICFMI